MTGTPTPAPTTVEPLAPPTPKPSLSQTLKRALKQTARKVGLRGLKILVLALKRMTGGIEEVVRLYLESLPFTPDLVLQAYQQGFFPIPRDDGRIGWFNPPKRGILPIEDFHIEKEVRRIFRQGKFKLTIDTAFAQVVRGCAEGKTRKVASWVTPQIEQVYNELHRMGVAHSIEVWQEGRLVGGLYGVQIGSYFAGESQFYLVSNAGKLAMVQTCQILKANGFTLHDSQYMTPYMQRFGGYEIPREEFRRRLARAIAKPARFEFVDVPV